MNLYNWTSELHVMSQLHAGLKRGSKHYVGVVIFWIEASDGLSSTTERAVLDFLINTETFFVI